MENETVIQKNPVSDVSKGYKGLLEAVQDLFVSVQSLEIMLLKYKII